MHNRAATRKVISGASCRRRNDQSIALHRGQEDVINIDVESTHELSVTPGNADFIERMADCGQNFFTTFGIDKHSSPRNSNRVFRIDQLTLKARTVINSR